MSLFLLPYAECLAVRVSPTYLIALVLAGQCVRQVTCHDNAIRSASNCYSNSTHLCMLPLRPFLMTADSGDFLQPVLDWLHP